LGTVLISGEIVIWFIGINQKTKLIFLMDFTD
jgi:hypothetical protein